MSETRRGRTRTGFPAMPASGKTDKKLGGIKMGLRGAAAARVRVKRKKCSQLTVRTKREELSLLFF